MPRGARTLTLDNLSARMRASGLDVTRRGLTFHLERRDALPGSSSQNPHTRRRDIRHAQAGMLRTSQTAGIFLALGA